MPDSRKSKKGPIEEVKSSLSRKAKLERISRDITERKQVEEKIKETSHRFQTIFNSIDDGLAIMDKNLIVKEVNKCRLEALGLNRNRVIGKKCYEVFQHLDKPCETCPVQPVFEKGEMVRLEKSAVLGDGTVKYFDTQGTPVFDERGTVVQVVSSIRDITEHKRVEEALRESEEVLRAILDASPDVIHLLDINGIILSSNEGFAKRLDLEIDDVVGKCVFDYAPFESMLRRKAAVEKVFRTGEPLQLEDMGRTSIFESHVHPVLNPAGEVTAVAVYARDITERKKAEEALRESEKKYRTIIETSHEVIFSKNRDGHYHTLNLRAAISLGGTCIEDVEGKTDYELLPKEQADALRKVDEQIMKSGRDIDVEEVVRNAQGEDRIYLSRKWPLYDNEGRINGISCFAMDITGRKKTEKKLLDYQRQLRSLASQLSLTEERERRRIAAELHDQISQSLVISKIKLDALRASAPSGDLAKTLEEVCDSLDETIQGTRSLTFDLSSPILYELGFEAAVAEWLAEQIQRKHGIATGFEDDEQPKPLDEDVRVLLFRDVRELLINVVKHSQADKVKVCIRKVGSRIHVSVEDNGVGFDPAKAASTAVRTGGFGLFSIRQRLEQLGGHLEIESKPGDGTKATVMVPLKRERINDRE